MGTASRAGWEAPALRGVPTLRIHGTRDMLITPMSKRGTTLIEGAGHTVNMTHSAEVNRLLARFLSRVSPRL